ncbi:MAG: hypothetical protein AAFW82_09970 [Pseudomonadota bacterium]
MAQRKTYDNLFPQIATFRALKAAAREAIKGKRKKPGAAAFMANFEREILALERQLRDGTYRPGKYVEILVRDPKERLVSAAPFRDRGSASRALRRHLPDFRTGVHRQHLCQPCG